MTVDQLTNTSSKTFTETKTHQPLKYYSPDELSRSIAARSARLAVLNAVWEVHLSGAAPNLDKARVLYDRDALLIMQPHDSTFTERAEQIIELDLRVGMKYAERNKLHELIESEQEELFNLQFNKMRPRL